MVCACAQERTVDGSSVRWMLNLRATVSVLFVSNSVLHDYSDGDLQNCEIMRHGQRNPCVAALRLLCSHRK